MNILSNEQWIETEEGIGQIISLHDCYVEEFSPSFLSGEKNLNDLDYTICHYKLFMNFEGTVRKRSAIFNTNAFYCGELSEKYRKVLGQKIEKNSEAYEKFLKLKSKKPVKVNFDLFFHDTGDVDIGGLKGEIEKLNLAMNKPFIFEDFLRLLSDKNLDIDLIKANKNPNLTLSDFYIRLHNEDYASKDKKLQFKKVELIINS